MDKPTLVVICGPTATGKTEVAFQVAKKLNTEIISFDSVQVYKGFDIGTAKPSSQLRQEIPHHLIDEVSPTEIFTAGDFRKRALDLLIELRAKDFVVLVGGTGFYLQALVKGMYDIPPVSLEVKKEIENEFAAKGSQVLFEEVKRRDPEYAAKIHSNDSYRISRALELMRSGGKTVTQLTREFKPEPLKHKVIQYGLRRKKDILQAAVESRTDFMIQKGLTLETEKCLKLYPEARALESVGYKETCQYLKGEISLNDLAPAIVKSTMALAKRQATWFKRDGSITWLDPDELGVEDITHHIVRST